MFFEVGYFLEFKSKLKETRNTVDMITVQLKHGILFAAVAAFAECFRQNPSISACHSTLHLHQVPTPWLAAKQKKLLPKGISPRARGKTALHSAVEGGKHDVVEWLLAAGANVVIVDTDGRGLGAGRVGIWHQNLSSSPN